MSPIFASVSNLDTMSKQRIKNTSPHSEVFVVLLKGLCPKIYVPLVINTVLSSHPSIWVKSM